MKKRRLKGYTLLELVVVMGIIGILAGITVPNMIYQLGRSKYNTAVGEAQAIYNSAQTVVQKYEVIDMAITDPSDKKLSGTHSCGNLTGKTFSDGTSSELYDKIKTLYDDLDDVSFAIEIQDYKIVRVVYSDSETSEVVGVYPNAPSYSDYTKENILAKW